MRIKTVYHRYFRVDTGPIADKASQMVRVNNEVKARYLAVLAEIGAEDTYWVDDHKLVAMTPTVDKHLYRKCRDGGYYPKRNTKFGKDLNKRFSDIARDIINKYTLIELCNKPRVICMGMRLYFPTPTVLPHDDYPVVFIAVPWYDEDPDVIAEYVARKSKGQQTTGETGALLWGPTTHMTEVKEWEVLKEVGEYNEKNV